MTDSFRKRDLIGNVFPRFSMIEGTDSPITMVTGSKGHNVYPGSGPLDGGKTLLLLDTIERMEIIRDLRLGEFDVLVGINLLREGLDIPEVSLVAILDADKEGFLRSETSLVQTIGRAARNEHGEVIMYADSVTPSMERAITETLRRREIQEKYNTEHGITPKTIKKDVHQIIEITSKEKLEGKKKHLSKKERQLMIAELTKEMKEAAKLLEFEHAAYLRDQIAELEGKK